MSPLQNFADTQAETCSLNGIKAFIEVRKWMKSLDSRNIWEFLNEFLKNHNKMTEIKEVKTVMKFTKHVLKPKAGEKKIENELNSVPNCV